MKTQKYKGICAHCGKPFVGTKAKVYCSDRCSDLHYYAKTSDKTPPSARNCGYCGDPFTPKSRGSMQMYCTKSCSRQAAYDRKTRKREAEKSKKLVQQPRYANLPECPFATGLIRDVFIYGPANYHPGSTYAAL